MDDTILDQLHEPEKNINEKLQCFVLGQRAAFFQHTKIGGDALLREISPIAELLHNVVVVRSL
jgi:hypothetical protein